MSNLSITRPAASPEVSLESLGLKARWKRIVDTVDTWNRRHRTRRQFADVEYRILRDVGVSEADRFIEVNKPFWEA